MSDLISRQAAIDALEKIDCSDGVGLSALKCDAVDDAVVTIKALPSAQPDPDMIHLQKEQAYMQGYEEGKQAAQAQGMKSRWYEGRCLRCGEHAPFHSMALAYYKSNFCPNCGAWMRGEQNGKNS